LGIFYRVGKVLFMFLGWRRRDKVLVKRQEERWDSKIRITAAQPDKILEADLCRKGPVDHNIVHVQGADDVEGGKEGDSAKSGDVAQLAQENSIRKLRVDVVLQATNLGILVAIALEDILLKQRCDPIFGSGRGDRCD
jgi:hypothetical protein